MSLRNIAFAASLSSLCLIGVGGCGGLPDLKIDVVYIPQDVTKLAALIWEVTGPGTFQPAQDSLVFDLPAPASSTDMYRPFSFGLKLDPGRDASYLVTVGAFSGTPNASGLYCLRASAAGVEATSFSFESTLTIPMPMNPPSEILNTWSAASAPDVCYSTLDKQTDPKIVAGSLQTSRVNDNNGYFATLLQLYGWNFSPTAQVTVTLQPVPPPGYSGPSPQNRTLGQSAIQRLHPDLIQATFDVSDLVALAFPMTKIHVEVQNPGSATKATADFMFLKP